MPDHVTWGHIILAGLIVALRFVFKRDIRKIVIEFKNGDSEHKEGQ